MKKKVKRYDGGGDVYTGDDPIVKYRMGMTDKVSGPSESTIEDESNRGNISPAAAEFNKGTGNQSSAPAPAPTKKVVGKAIAKAAAEEKSEPKKANPVQEAKDVVSAKGASAPKMMRGETNSGVDLKKALFGSSSDSPRMRAAKRTQASDASNYSMKSGGKVGSASKRADGIAMKGKTRGKIC